MALVEPFGVAGLAVASAVSSTVYALMLLVPVAGAPLLGNFGVVLANVLTYIAAILTIVSGAEYIIKNFSCISNM